MNRKAANIDRTRRDISAFEWMVLLLVDYAQLFILFLFSYTLELFYLC